MSQSSDSPAALGYRLPAEWERHQATWISWPHNQSTWPGAFEHAEPVMARAVAALTAGEQVRINVLDDAHMARARRYLEEAAADPSRIVFHAFPTNDAWCRDHGAIFITRRAADSETLAAIDCGFNSWGGKYPPFDLDDAIPRQMADVLGVPRFEGGMILEGGSIDGNGKGMLLTTEQCLLNPNRNPGMSRAQIEARLGELFGADEVLWLGQGIAGDDTDGHVDDLTRFVAPDAVVTVVEADPGDANFVPLRENLERLRAWRRAAGGALEVIELPMPAALFYRGERLPASYANFYVGNSAVLVPAFADPADGAAVGILEECFPERSIVPIDCRKLVIGLGAFHCLTQQVPELAES